MTLNKVICALCLSIVMFSPLLLQAGEEETHFNAGNAAYSVGEYDKAIEIYKGLLEQEGNSSGLLYNLANSYAQKGEIGLAILNYERALKLSPGDPDILGNLTKVRKDQGLFTEKPGIVARIVQFFSIDTWTGIALCCLVFITILLFIRLKVRPSPRSLYVSGICAVFLLSVSVLATVYSYQRYNPLVVIARDVKLQVSPFTGADSAGAIKEGRLLFPVKQHGDYIYVVDDSGRKGWLQNDSIEAVCLQLFKFRTAS